MAYNPTVWEENDLASAERMNKIEQGIASASEQPEGLLPTGGTTGQMLTKASDNDFDAEWTDVPSFDGGAKILPVTIQKGRMRGDVDGDGEITQNDFVAIEDHINGYTTLTGVNLWCADANGDGDITVFDSITVQKYLSGLSWNNYGVRLDYYGNWTYNHHTLSIPDYWETDISIPDLAEGMSAIVVVPGEWASDMFTEAEISDGLIRIKSKRPPIEDVPCFVIYGEGNGTAAIYTSRYFTADDIGAVTPENVVKTFNSRRGIVTPQSGDYTASMVGAIPASAVSEIVVLTEDEHSALTEKPSTTLYLIPEE